MTDISSYENGGGIPAFRSILPHEPLPTEEKGYIQLQGAFTPKRRNTEEGPDILVRDFWDQETLRDALISRLGTQHNHHTFLGLQHGAVDVLLLDSAAPFTKIRLVYESQQVASCLMKDFKREKMSVARLLHPFASDNIHFTNRAVQVSQSTQQPLALNNSSWTRSNPPKFRRLIARPGEDLTILQKEREETRFVFLNNMLDPSTEDVPAFWSDPTAVAEAVRQALQPFDSSGIGIEVFMLHKKLGLYCHLGMRSPRDAQIVIQKLQETRIEWKWRDFDGTVFSVPSGKLFLDYAAITNRSEAANKNKGKVSGEPLRSHERSVCTSTTDNVVVPGLVLVPNFVTEQEEEILMAALTGPHAPWAPSQNTMSSGGTVKRRVQHYGYVFDYHTTDVLRDRQQKGAECPPMPELAQYDRSKDNIEQAIDTALKEGRGWEAMAGVIERTRQKEFQQDKQGSCISYPHLNQLTINSYAVGEGIGSHVDTPSAFGDGLISISLNSGIVMEFRKVKQSETCDDVKKLVYLPPRSLLLMSGPARYEWEHMIVSRATDTHNDEVYPRKLRISLTLRTALTLDGQPMPLVASSKFPPVWGEADLTESSALATPDCERDHVHAVYDAIATQWHHTRGRRGVLWPGATQFLQQIPRGSLVADIGCGDGKYFPAIWEAGSYVIGTDISLPLLRTSLPPVRDRDNNVPESRWVSENHGHLRDRPSIAVADCMNVPLRTNSCDAAICIAVLHHLSTEKRRRRCLEELARIVKPGGLINVQAWAMEQDDDSKRRFATNDAFVPFNVQPKYLQLDENHESSSVTPSDDKKKQSKSTAQVYSEAFNADYDERKGLVVFKRYCHLYRRGELEDLLADIPQLKLIQSGVETGNHFMILEVCA